MKFEEILPEIRKGKKFRYAGGAFFDLQSFGRNYPADMLIGEQWELEPITKEISLKDLEEAWNQVVVPSGRGIQNYAASSSSFKLFSQILGFL
jgi:hypothetical protein